MDARGAWHAVRNWVPFTLRTIGYGTVSLTLGPLTRDRAASLWAMRAWSLAGARALGIQLEITGADRVPPAPFVYCANHQSTLDILVLGAALPGDFKWAAKRSLMNIPFLGWHLRLAGHVPVDRRGGARAAAKVIERFVATLRAGKPLLVFPEGTRSSDGAVQPFKRGAFVAAVRANVPVVPVALEGTHQLMRKGDADAANEGHHPVAVRIGAPIHPSPHGSEAERIDDLRDRTQAAIVDLHAELSGKPPRKRRPTAARQPLHPPAP